MTTLKDTIGLILLLPLLCVLMVLAGVSMVIRTGETEREDYTSDDWR